MMKMKITPDSELATPEAIQFRIEQLNAQIRSAPSFELRPLLRRRAALKDRLPKTPGAAIAPAVNAALLISKAQENEYSNRVTLYA